MRAHSQTGTMKTRGQTHKAPLKKTYELDDTPEEDNCSYDGDKENADNAAKPGTKSKRKGGTSRASKKGLSKRQKSDANAANPDSPPIFAFKTAKTSFRKRKVLKHERQLQNEEENKKRIDEMIAYFKTLDEQKLETA
ncbi:hypothetical protein PR003_g6198 [Phytophthora rubi]|uniref:Uncharacterized protein n=1 Tax=Phytophthora rubi TaxID=129364 RepID=A0A6A4G2Y5_9STRA|nr:hypothetical protein PR002_g6301 [Phytophthora rubi]KAE9043303.1 hypothetical protein PR001_g5843 [Phytophthora rubi]KAE9348835.1 hypothetical protein PR003_g6198 [Phytophthora rubi]